MLEKLSLDQNTPRDWFTHLYFPNRLDTGSIECLINQWKLLILAVAANHQVPLASTFPNKLEDQRAACTMLLSAWKRLGVSKSTNPIQRGPE